MLFRARYVIEKFTIEKGDNMTKEKINIKGMHCKSCTEKIEGYTKGLSYSQFKKDQMRIDAVIRNLEVIGEAVKKLPEGFRKEYPSVEWAKIAGLRDILIHE